jgi:hypothetical protein
MDVAESANLDNEILSLVPNEDQDAVRWFFELREQCDRAIEQWRPRPGSSDPQADASHLERVEWLAILGKRLRKALRVAETWERRQVVRNASAEIAGRLGIDSAPPDGWAWEAVARSAPIVLGAEPNDDPSPYTFVKPQGEHRGDVLLPSYNHPHARVPDKTPKPARPVRRTRARHSKNLAERMTKIMRVLAQHSDGLSENALRKKLGGRAQTTQALQALLGEGRIKKNGSHNDSRYVRAVEVVRLRRPRGAT